jgi:hypothetical protein
VCAKTLELVSKSNGSGGKMRNSSKNEGILGKMSKNEEIE